MLECLTVDANGEKVFFLFFTHSVNPFGGTHDINIKYIQLNIQTHQVIVCRSDRTEPYRQCASVIYYVTLMINTFARQSSPHNRKIQSCCIVVFSRPLSAGNKICSCQSNGDTHCTHTRNTHKRRQVGERLIVMPNGWPQTKSQGFLPKCRQSHAQCTNTHTHVYCFACFSKYHFSIAQF